jgi:hypothetical protein
MKTHTPFLTALSMALVSWVTTTYAAPAIYCVHDEGLNDSQFCVGYPLPFPSEGILPMGPIYPDCDIEALDLDENGEDLFYNLYAASGDDTPRPGHLYLVDKMNGAPLWDLGDIWAVDAAGKPLTNIREVDAISFNPATHVLWGWGQHTGLFFINPPPPPPSISAKNEIDPKVGCVANESPVGIVGATVVFPAVEREIEDLTWNRAGTVLYGVENLHDDPVDSHGDPEDLWPNMNFDFDDGIRLWAFDTISGFVGSICPNLVPAISGLMDAPAEIEGLEVLPRNLVPPPPGFSDLLLVGFHGPHKMVYAALGVNFINANTPPVCRIIWDGSIPTDGLHDIEGLAYDPEPPFGNSMASTSLPPSGNWKTY